MKKKLVVLTATAALGAAAVPAMAFENEFHGSYTAAGFISNAYDSGTGPIILKKDAGTNNFVDQRARLQYIAKANDDLKLVTHFELDTKFGGRTAGKYTNTSDAGGLDADGVSLETKNVYLDFNIPTVPVNAKIGVQPWADAYKGTFGIFDGSGATLTGKFGAATVTLAGFRLADAEGAVSGTADNLVSGKKTSDLVVVDGKFAINKDITVGANYYALMYDIPVAARVAEFTNTIGANVAAKFGAGSVDAFVGYQFGDYRDATGQDLSAWALGATGKLKAGPGVASLSALYLSGEKDASTSGDQGNWQAISANTSYYNDANMWLLIRNPLSINTSGAIGGNDLTKGGRGLIGVFAGYNGGIDKLLFGANIGYAQVAEERGSEDAMLGTEINAMVGYKVYDNLTAKFNIAYAFLGDGAKNSVANGGIAGITGNTAAGEPDDPYVANLVLQYAF